MWFQLCPHACVYLRYSSLPAWTLEEANCYCWVLGQKDACFLVCRQLWNSKGDLLVILGKDGLVRCFFVCFLPWPITFRFQLDKLRGIGSQHPVVWEVCSMSHTPRMHCPPDLSLCCQPLPAWRRCCSIQGRVLISQTRENLSHRCKRGLRHLLFSLDTLSHPFPLSVCRSVSE